MKGLDPKKRKQALRALSYGLYVATSRAGDRAAAGTITWLSQCSFEPPLVMCGIKRDSRLHKAICDSRVFAVNVVGKSQKAMAMAFFKTAEEDGDRLGGYRTTPGSTGAPILLDAPAWFECKVRERFREGDHTVFIAEVVAAGTHHDEEPLTVREAGFSYGG